MLQNDRLLLRALEPEDLDSLYKWENDTSVWVDGVTHSAFSRYALKQYISHSQSDIYDDKCMRYIIELKENHCPAGCIDLYDFDIHNRKIGVAILVDPECQRNNVAKQSIELILEYVFSFLQLKQVYAFVSVNNTPSIALFRSCGFAETACLKQWVKAIDGYSDVCVFQKIAE